MPSKNMLPKGKRRQSVKQQYRAVRSAQQEAALETPDNPWEEEVLLDEEAVVVEATPAATPTAVSAPIPQVEEDIRSFAADAAAKGMRLDAYLAKALPDISRARAQLLIDAGQVQVDGKAAKSSLKLLGGEKIEIEGEPRPAPLRAFAEDIPLDVIYEDAHLAVINKPAGMMVHAGSGATESERNRGTLVNALLHHFNKLSSIGGELRPGIVHRLDKMTSGLIVVAKNDKTHRALAQMFSERALDKQYIALVQGEIGSKARGNAERDSGTINLPIARDPVRRTRMTTRVRESYFTIDSPGSPALRHPEQEELKEPKNYEARSAVSHYQVVERLQTPSGKFTLVQVHIETGRTHQIRVHMQALGNPVVGDTLYGAATQLPGLPPLGRNFLHAERLVFQHPITGKELDLSAPLPPELQSLLEKLRSTTK